MKLKIRILLILSIMLVCGQLVSSFGEIELKKLEWEELKGDHFIVYFVKGEKFAKDVLRYSEKYYDKIADDLGYPRYSNFWQWDNRAKIYIYPTQALYIQSGDHPQWSSGMAYYDTKTIYTYAGSRGFAHASLPHEITHLIFRDYVGFEGEIPKWIDEGVAQWEEPEKRSQIKVAIRYIYEQKALISLDKFMAMDISFERNENIVKSYYIQAMSIIDFLINEHGSKRFIHFCRNLRDGKSMEEALRFAYPTTIRSLEDLEERWKKYIIK